MINGEIFSQRLKLVNEHVVSDTINYLEVAFSFKTDDWDGLEKWAHFARDSEVYDIRLTDDHIRKEDHLNLSAGKWKVYIHGNEFRGGEVVQRVTTNMVTLYVEPTGTLDGEPFPEIPASVTEQILARLENVEQNGGGGGDGYSPEAKVERVDGGVRVTITDKNGTTSEVVQDGKSGVHVGNDAPPAGTRVWVYPAGRKTEIPKIDDTLTQPGYAADAAAVGKVSVEFGDLKESLGGTGKTITIDSWVRGGILTTTGEDSNGTGIEATRVRTGFIEVKKGDTVSATNRRAVTIFFYDPETHAFIKVAGIWLAEYTFAEDAMVRLVGKKTTADATITDDDVKNYYVNIRRNGIVQSLIGAVQQSMSGVTRVAEWYYGNISSSDGLEVTSSTGNRIRTGFIKLKQGDKITSSNNAYFYVYFYDPVTREFLKHSGKWCEEYIASGNETVRLVGKISSSGISGTGDVFTDEIISNFNVEIHHAQNITGVRIEQLPTLALDGDVSTMTKDDAVTLNYKLFGQSGTCTCKWQGSSSQRYAKKNYTIKLDTPIDGWDKWATFVNSMRAANGNISKIPTESRWGEQKKFCTKANWIDPSHARNIVNARLWGQVVQDRIAKGEITDNRTIAPNYGAIDGFPIEIVINGESQGLYTFNIPKEGWQFAMGDSNTEYLVSGEDNYLESSRWKALAALDEEDFGLEYTADGVELDTVRTSLNTAIQAAINAGADWETTLSPYVDINSVFDYFIFTCCVSNVDALARNILYGTYDGTKWFMSAYDMDTTYGTDPYNTGLYHVKTGRTEFAEAAKIHRLAYLMYTYSKDKLIARYNELRADILSEENVWYEFSSFVADISTRNYDVDRDIWTTIPGTSLASISQYLDYYRMHCALLDKEIESLNQQ